MSWSLFDCFNRILANFPINLADFNGNSEICYNILAEFCKNLANSNRNRSSTNIYI